MDEYLKHTSTLFSFSDHYIPSREWRVIVDQVQVGYGIRISQVWPELLIMRDPHGGTMCFKSVKTFGALHS